MAITYVGGKTASHANSAQTISLTDLTGGSDAAPATGDIVIVINGHPETADTSVSVTTTGYTNQELYADDTRDADGAFCYKVMGGTPDTDVTVPGTTGAAVAGSTVIKVFRGVDTTTPLDVVTTTATGINGTLANSPSITPTTSGAKILALGHGTHPASNSAAITGPANMSGFLTISAAGGGRSSWAGIAEFDWTSGAFDPDAVTGGAGVANDSWVAFTVALRPAAGGDSGAASSSGAATVSAVGASTAAASASAAGVGAASAVGAAASAASASASGIGAASAVGAATAQASATAAGAGAATGVGASSAAAVATAAGVATVSAVAGTDGSVATAAGAATVSAVGASTVSAVATASGAASAGAVGASVAASVGSAAGTSSASGVSEAPAAEEQPILGGWGHREEIRRQDREAKARRDADARRRKAVERAFAALDLAPASIAPPAPVVADVRAVVLPKLEMAGIAASLDRLDAIIGAVWAEAVAKRREEEAALVLLLAS